jgi:hypothetical protein
MSSCTCRGAFSVSTETWPILFKGSARGHPASCTASILRCRPLLYCCQNTCCTGFRTPVVLLSGGSLLCIPCLLFHVPHPFSGAGPLLYSCEGGQLLCIPCLLTWFSTCRRLHMHVLCCIMLMIQSYKLSCAQKWCVFRNGCEGVRCQGKI